MSASMLTGGAAGPAGAANADDILTLVTNRQRLTGWTDIEVTRGIERMPSSCSIGMTERYPGNEDDIIVQPGDTCQVLIGADLVITGYIDQVIMSIEPAGHRVVVQVRGKCEDLVDCDAGIYPSASSSSGYTLRGFSETDSSLLGLARKLASPFGITVSSLTGDDIPLSGPTSGAPVQFNIILTEKPIEIIERAARYATVLAYEGTDGNLILAGVGTSKQASGLSQGVNVQAASVAFTMDQRFSIYLPSLVSVNSQFDDKGIVTTTMAPVYDQAVPRFRPKIVVSPQSQYGISLAQNCAAWEMNRRRGRSQRLSVTCDSWRDSANTLWSANALAPIDIPALKLSGQVWVIAEVTFVRNLDRGTVADLVLMPAEAFTTEPSSLELYDWQIAEALRQGAAAKAAQKLPSSGGGTG